MRYNKFSTLRLSVGRDWNDCLKSLSDLAVAEGCVDTLPAYTSGIVVLDSDRIERKLSTALRRSPNKSMDLCCVISDNTLGLSEILLVELRFNYQNMKNLKKSDLYDKVNGTAAALAPNTIHNKYYFIFNSSLKFQAMRRFRNMVPSMPQNFVATDMQDLLTLHF